MTVDYKALHEQAKGHRDWLVGFRRECHMEPEIGLNTFKTAEKVERELKKMGITPTTNWAKGPGMEKGAGLVFDLGTGQEPVVLLRADMDGLPITEDNDFEFKSKIEGRMHACGHDSHTTMLLGAVKLLKEREDKLAGTVRIMFQPGEEGYRGGYYMVNEGVLTKEPAVQRALALHVVPMLPTGVIETGNSSVLAGGTDWEINIVGQGGHAGTPAKTRDPIIAGVAIVNAFQTIVSRETLGAGARKVGLISVCAFNSGNTHNVIPGTATIKGTARAVNHDTIKLLFKRMEEMTESISKAYNVEATLTWTPHTLPPLTISSEVREEMQEIVDQATVFPFHFPAGEFQYGMEDFAYVADAVPSAMYGIGIGSGHSTANKPPTSVGLHDPKFALDEEILPQGAAFLAAGALNLIQKLSTVEAKTLKTES